MDDAEDQEKQFCKDDPDGGDGDHSCLAASLDLTLANQDLSGQNAYAIAGRARDRLRNLSWNISGGVGRASRDVVLGYCTML